MATLIVGAGGFATIQEAVNAAGNGDTILIRSGTYVEQVTIDAKANLIIRPFDANSVVEIKAPATLVANGVSETYGDAVRSVLSINNSTNIKIDNIRVDGSFAGDTNSVGEDQLVGVAVLNSSADLNRIKIENVGGSPEGGFFGVQTGQGLFVDGGTDAPTLRVRFTNGEITDFQKTGAIITGVIADFTGNKVTGIGLTDGIAQNGLQIFNAEGKVENNRITDFGYTDSASFYSTGIVAYEPTNTLQINGNLIQGAQGAGAGAVGIDVSDTGGKLVTINKNTFDSLGDGIVAYSFIGGIGLEPAPRFGTNTYTNIDRYGINFDPETDFVGGQPFTTTKPYNIDGTSIADFIAGSGGNDVLRGGDGNDQLFGRGGVDRLDGGNGDDTIDGGEGADSLNGDAGNDTLEGGAGNDRVDGGAGNDRLIDGTGDDRYTGGAGVDTFEFATEQFGLFGNDTVVDFNAARALDVLNFGAVTKNGEAVTDLDTNNDGKIDQSDGGVGADDFITLRGSSLVFSFDQGTVTLQSTRSIGADQATAGFEASFDGVTFREAGPDGPFETGNQNLDPIVGQMLATYGVPYTVDNLTINGGKTDTFKLLWDYLDDLYTNGENYYNLALNETFVRLGVEYVEYLENGGQPLTFVTAKFASDSNGNGIPQREQSMHDNLLGNLEPASINDKFGSDPALKAELLALIPDEYEARPRYSGNEGDRGGAAHDGARAFDYDKGWDRPDYSDESFGKVDPVASDDRNNDGVDEQMFFGTGNSNDFYNVVRHEGAGVELALKAKEFGANGGDYGPSNRFYDADGVLNYTVSTGASPDNANRADWSIDYAATILSQGADENWTFKLLVDIDETEGVNLVDIGLTTFGGQKQGSSNYGFGAIRSAIDTDDATPGIQPYSFGPGEFDIVLQAYADGVLVASNHIIVHVEEPAAQASFAPGGGMSAGELIV